MKTKKDSVDHLGGRAYGERINITEYPNPLSMHRESAFRRTIEAAGSALAIQDFW
jgi:hypothetical protein